MDPMRPSAPANTTSVLEQDGGIGDKVGQVGDTAKQGATEAVATIKQEVSAATSDVADQARTLFDQSRSQLRTEAQAQTEKLSGSLRQIGTQMQALADGRPEEAGPVGDYARQAADGLGRCAQSIQQKGLDGVLRDAQDFARRRPGTFLLGAVVAGVVAGRFVRNARGSQVESQVALPPLQSRAPVGAYSSMVGSGVGSFQATDRSGNWSQPEPAWDAS